MKIKTWLIHKLGGRTIEDMLPPQPRLIEKRVEVVPIIVEYEDIESCDEKVCDVEKYIENILASKLASAIKEYMKIEKETDYHGNTLYTAKVNIVKVKE